MGCECGKGSNRQVTKYTITDDPEARKYLTEAEAKREKRERGLEGQVVGVQG